MRSPTGQIWNYSRQLETARTGLKQAPTWARRDESKENTTSVWVNGAHQLMRRHYRAGMQIFADTRRAITGGDEQLSMLGRRSSGWQQAVFSRSPEWTQMLAAASDGAPPLLLWMLVSGGKACRQSVGGGL